MRDKFVAKKNIERVIDGFKQFYDHMLKTQQFNAVELKEFMEPVFEKNGYRHSLTLNDQINILLIHDAGVGDFVIKSSAIKEVRRLYPNAHITLIVFPRALSLAEHCPYVDEVIPNGRECNWHSLPDMYRWNAGIAQLLLRRPIDIVYAFAQYPSTILLSYMSGARQRISFQFTPENGAIECGPFYVFAPLLTVEVPKSHYGTHSIDHNLNLLDYTLHAPVVDRELEMWFNPIDKAAAYQLLQNDLADGNKIIALCMGGTSLRKQWQPENYAQLVERIVKSEPNTKFVILGGGQQDELSAAAFKQSLSQQTVKHIIDLTSRSNYRRDTAIMSLCNLYIGNDTGNMMMAAAVKLPVLSPNCFAADLPFERSIPRGYYPYHVPSVTVQPKHALGDCQHSKDGYGCINPDRHCITQITVDIMFDGYNQLKERIAQNNCEPLFIS